MLAVFTRASTFQDRVRRELPSLPAGVEPFRPFDASVGRLLQNVVLIGTDGKQQLWPQRSSGMFAVEVSSGMVVSHTTNWSHPDALAQLRANAEAENKRWADWAAQATKDQEERRNAEVRAAARR